MKKRGISWLMILMLVLSSMVIGLAGCNQQQTPAPAPPQEDGNGNEEGSGDSGSDTDPVDSGEVPDEVQFFNYPFMADPRNIDGAMTNFMLDLTIIGNVHQTMTELIFVDEVLTMVPGAAESWEISEDGLVYTFNLRDMNWEDGQALTAHDYALTLFRALDPNSGSVKAGDLFNIENALEYFQGNADKEDVGIRVPDDKTLEITLKQVTPYFINLTYAGLFTPTRQDMVDQYGEQFGIIGDSILASGPFKVKEWVNDVHLILEKNENYWDADSVLLETITFKMIRDVQAIMSELMNGTIDRTSVTIQEWRDRLITTGNFSYGDYVLAGTYFLIFNTDYEVNGVKPLSNVKVRQAISAAIDREEATFMLRGDMAIPATGFIPSTVGLDNHNFREVTNYNPIEAIQARVPDPKALLEEGLAELGISINDFTIEFLAGGTTAQHRSEAEFFQEVLQRELGLKLEITQVETAVRTQNSRAGDFGITYSLWYAGQNDPGIYFNNWLTNLETHSYKTGYDNQQFDEYVLAANSTMDEEIRRHNFNRAEWLLAEEDCIVAPIYHPISSMMTAKYMRGFVNQNFAPTAFKTVYTVGRE